MRSVYRVVSYYPLKIQDGRGRFVGHQEAEAWCATNGHRWGPLWPDQAWIDAEWAKATEAAERLKADFDAEGRDSTSVAAALFIPAGRWNCEQCGESRWQLNGESPEDAKPRSVRGLIDLSILDLIPRSADA
jgi:hypothetical protein